MGTWFDDDNDQGLLIRASLKLRRLLATTTGWTLVALMPLTLTAFTLVGLQGRRAGELPFWKVIGVVLTLWAIHLTAIATAALVQLREAPQGREFLTFRWFALAPVFHAFLASWWVAAFAFVAAGRHSWTAIACGLVVWVIGILLSIYLQAYMVKPLDAVELKDPEREALKEWCAELKITPPWKGSLRPASLFRTDDWWSWSRLAAAGVWLLAIALAPLFGANVDVVVELGIIGFIGGHVGYRAGFSILARINPYDRPSGFLSTVTGIVLLYAGVWTMKLLFPQTPISPAAFGPMPPP